MKVVPLLFFLLAASIQGGFAALDNHNPLTNPDLPPKVRAHLESRILQWLCPRIKMTASNYIRSRLYPLSGRLTASLSSIPASTRPSSDIIYMRPPFYPMPPFLLERPKLQSWLEQLQLTSAQKQKLDDALMASVAAYLKTNPNVFMVVCWIDNNDPGGGASVSLYTIGADVNDTASIQLSPSNSNSAVVGYPTSFPYGIWSTNEFFFSTCLVKSIASMLLTCYWYDISSVTYSHGGQQIVLTQQKPVFWSN
jgi:hypothetical protein